MQVWNTGPLTRYFNSGMHLYEVNTTNPLGTKGALALRYGELCKEASDTRLPPGIDTIYTRILILT